MPERFDRGFVRQVLDRTSIVALIGQSVDLTRRGRRHWARCPFHGERDASFIVSDDRGTWRCFGCGKHGDAVGWLMETAGLSFPAAVEELAIRAGLAPDRDGRQKSAPAKPVRLSEAEITAEQERSVQYARSVLQRAVPAAGTLVETYLRARGILGPVPAALRFLPSAWHRDSGTRWPAMVAAVKDPAGRVTGAHRTFLAPDGSGKASVEKAKMMLGRCWTGACRLAAAEPGLAIAEGIETALSVRQATGLPVWAVLSEGNLATVALPPFVRMVTVCADADGHAETAERRLQDAVTTHSALGRTVRVAKPPTGMDFNDWMRVLSEAPAVA